LIFAGDYKDCALKMGVEFFRTNQLDTSCVRTLPPLDFRGRSSELQEISRNVFGLVDM
jgi:hypothetical protein